MVSSPHRAQWLRGRAPDSRLREPVFIQYTSKPYKLEKNPFKNVPIKKPFFCLSKIHPGKNKNTPLTPLTFGLVIGRKTAISRDALVVSSFNSNGSRTSSKAPSSHHFLVATATLPATRRHPYGLWAASANVSRYVWRSVERLDIARVIDSAAFH